jgi:hypothetical protein
MLTAYINYNGQINKPLTQKQLINIKLILDDAINDVYANENSYGLSLTSN